LCLSAVPLSASPKKKKGRAQAMFRKMEAVPCGANKEAYRLGHDMGIGRKLPRELRRKLCPQYLLRTDEWNITFARPTVTSVVLPVGHEVEYKIKAIKCS